MPSGCLPTFCLLCGSVLLSIVLGLPGSTDIASTKVHLKTAADLNTAAPSSGVVVTQTTSPFVAVRISDTPATAGPSASSLATHAVTRVSTDNSSVAFVTPAGNSSGTKISVIEHVTYFQTVTSAPSLCRNISEVLFIATRNVSVVLRPPDCHCLEEISVLPNGTWLALNSSENIWQQLDFTFWGRTCVTFRCRDGSHPVPFDITSGYKPSLQVDLGPLRNSSLSITWHAALPSPYNTSTNSTNSTDGETAHYVTQVQDRQGNYVCNVSVPACRKGGDTGNLTWIANGCSLSDVWCSGVDGVCSEGCSASRFHSQVSCSFVVEQLQPWATYDITFRDHADAMIAKHLKTGDTVPWLVKQISVTKYEDANGHTDAKVKISWTFSGAKGPFWYTLSVNGQTPFILNGSDVPMGSENLMPMPVEYNVEYTFEVQACSHAGCSVGSKATYTLSPGKPKPIPRVHPKYISLTTKDLRFPMVNPHALFSASAGNIIEFEVALERGNKSVEVSSDPPKCCLGTPGSQYLELPCLLWDKSEAKELHARKEYDLSQRCQGDPGLLPDTDYCLFIVGYTSDNQWASSECFAIAHTPPEPDHLSAILVPVLLLALLILAVVVVLLLRRKKLLRFRLPWERISHRRSHHDLELTRRRLTAKHILLKDFASHVEQMHENSNLGFSREYHDIKCVSPKHPFDTAIYAGNIGKNRYADIMPFDHSRVHLITNDEDEYDGSDYINANYIPGFNSQREYIATQGPLPSTIDDFWRMIWEQNVPTIVMLTSLIERGNTKCEKYWPDAVQAKRQSQHSGSDGDDGEDETEACYGDIHVTPIDFKSFDSYDLTVLELKQMSVKKRVNHFYYRLWPDMSCPHDKDVFIDFVEQVRKSHLPSGCSRHAVGPMLVHCSAGVGRTGTFIAVDVLLQKILVHPYIDVPAEVMNLREHRCRMVQTEDQYIFIHDCISNAINMLESNATDVPCNGTLQQKAYGHSRNGSSPRVGIVDEQGDDGQQRSLARRAGAVRAPPAAAATNMNGSPVVAAQATYSRESSSSDSSSDKHSRRSMPPEEGPLLQSDQQWQVLHNA